MVFFDLNIPYVEDGRGGGRGGDGGKNNQKNARVKLVVKAMELGYSGIAYNFSIRGVMADCHGCSIRPLPLSSLLQMAPSLSSIVEFHRKILRVPLNSPFRQYTRLTVTVNSMIQAAALNSGNSILKTYDLVAVQPTNQTTFEHACEKAHVDLIAIDFSQKLPFRLKSQMVQKAIQRGLYFELIYSPLFSNTGAKSEMIEGAKLLVSWTRGKNVILSSSASTVNELRGPYDVINLSVLFGLPMHHAKAALSGNCRTLISNVLRKKHFYKEAVRVEDISSSDTVRNEDSWFGGWKMPDLISSGEGDLSLEDELLVAYPHNLKRDSSVSGMNKIEEQSETLQCGRAHEYLDGRLSAAGAQQSCGLGKDESSLPTRQLSGHEHGNAFLVPEDSSPQRPSSVLPSQSPAGRPPHSYPTAGQASVRENAAVGPRMKAFPPDIERDVQNIEVCKEASPCKDVNSTDVVVTAGSCKEEETMTHADTLTCADMFLNSMGNTIGSLVTGVVSAEKAKSLVVASCDKQVTEQEKLKTFTERGLLLFKCESQNSSLFSTPVHIFESCNEKGTFDAGMDENMPTITNKRTVHLSSFTCEQPATTDGNGAALGSSGVSLHDQRTYVLGSHIPALEKFKSGRSFLRDSPRTIHPLSRKIMLRHRFGKRKSKVGQNSGRKRRIMPWTV